MKNININSRCFHQKMTRLITVHQSQFELETLEPRIMLSGDGATSAPPPASTCQLVEQLFDEDEELSHGSDLIFKPPDTMFIEGFECVEEDEVAKAGDNVSDTLEVESQKGIITVDAPGLEKDIVDQGIENGENVTGIEGTSGPENELEKLQSPTALVETVCADTYQEEEKSENEDTLIINLESTAVDEDGATVAELVEILDAANGPPEGDNESVIPNLPGLELVDKDLSKIAGQIIYLDLDGEEDITYRGPVEVGAFDVDPFSMPEGEGSIDTITQELNTRFDPLEVTFTSERPSEFTDYSTLFIGGDSNAFAEYGTFYGLAEKIDVGNQDSNDRAFVFSEEFISVGNSGEYAIDALSEVIAHEAARLLGYVDPESWETEGLMALAADPPQTVTVLVGGNADSRLGDNDLLGLGQALADYWAQESVAGTAGLFTLNSLGNLTHHSGDLVADHRVVIFDWFGVADLGENIYDNAVGESLAAFLASSESGLLSVSNYLHILGHGRGATVASEAALHYLSNGFDVQQLTFLNAPNGTVEAWKGVGFVDNYYSSATTNPQQTLDGSYSINLQTDVPEADTNSDGQVSDIEVRQWYQSTTNSPITEPGYALRKINYQNLLEDGSRKPLRKVKLDIANGDFALSQAQNKLPGWFYFGSNDVTNYDNGGFLILDNSNKRATHSSHYFKAAITNHEGMHIEDLRNKGIKDHEAVWKILVDNGYIDETHEVIKGNVTSKYKGRNAKFDNLFNSFNEQQKEFINAVLEQYTLPLSLSFEAKVLTEGSSNLLRIIVDGDTDNPIYEETFTNLVAVPSEFKTTIVFSPQLFDNNVHTLTFEVVNVSAGGTVNGAIAIDNVSFVPEFRVGVGDVIEVDVDQLVEGSNYTFSEVLLLKDNGPIESLSFSSPDSLNDRNLVLASDNTIILGEVIHARRTIGNLPPGEDFQTRGLFFFVPEITYNDKRGFAAKIHLEVVIDAQKKNIVLNIDDSFALGASKVRFLIPPLQAEDFTKFSEDDFQGLFDNLVAKGYLNQDGYVLDAFRDLNRATQLQLNKEYRKKRAEIYAFIDRFVAIEELLGDIEFGAEPGAPSTANILRLQQRLRFLGFMGIDAELLDVTGSIDIDTRHAITVFNATLIHPHDRKDSIWKSAHTLDSWVTRLKEINDPANVPHWLEFPLAGFKAVKSLNGQSSTVIEFLNTPDFDYIPAGEKILIYKRNSNGGRINNTAFERTIVSTDPQNNQLTLDEAITVANLSDYQIIVPDFGWKNIDVSKFRAEDHHHATDWNLDVAAAAGLYYRAHYPQYSIDNPIEINDASPKSGGDSSSHSSHEGGLDIDVESPATDSGSVPFYKIHAYDKITGVGAYTVKITSGTNKGKYRVVFNNQTVDTSNVNPGDWIVLGNRPAEIQKITNGNMILVEKLNIPLSEARDFKIQERFIAAGDDKITATSGLQEFSGRIEPNGGNSTVYFPPAALLDNIETLGGQKAYLLFDAPVSDLEGDNKIYTIGTRGKTFKIKDNPTALESIEDGIKQGEDYYLYFH